MGKNLPFLDVQYVYNTACNLAKEAKYCVVPNHAVLKADFEKIRMACDIFKRNNLQVKILGGNPADDIDFPKLISYLNEIDLTYVITDNSFNVDKLISLKTKGVMFSLDTLEKNDIGGCSFIKSMKAKEAIIKHFRDFEYIGANITLNSMNIDEVGEIVKFLTEHNAIANICPMIIGKNADFKYRAGESKYSLDYISSEKIVAVSEMLLDMKRSGYKIGCPEEYLINLPNAIQYGRYNWSCNDIDTIPVMRLSPDLKIMICSDIMGELVSKYSVFDIEDNFDAVNRAWIMDGQRLKCCLKYGCYWSNVFIADVYRKKGLGTIEATRMNL